MNGCLLNVSGSDGLIVNGLLYEMSLKNGLLIDSWLNDDGFDNGLYNQLTTDEWLTDQSILYDGLLYYMTTYDRLLVVLMVDERWTIDWLSFYNWLLLDHGIQTLQTLHTSHTTDSDDSDSADTARHQSTIWINEHRGERGERERERREADFTSQSSISRGREWSGGVE
jgi:hypothetical protein